jgi:anhydro-N-acetylmuramic acid kinase
VTAPVFLGLISGTSADGVDAALVGFDPAPRLLFGQSYPYPAALRAAILEHSQQQARIDLDAYARLDVAIGQHFAEVALRVMADAGIERARIAAIGSHGQTLRHAPTGPQPFSLQVGDPNVIAERCGLATVADFRRRDVAAGGQGAPLMPAFHAAALSSAAEARAVLNLGGIGNLTLLPREGGVRGFDTGPANGLMDAWCEREFGRAYDAGGELAARGRVDEALLARLLDEPYFRLPAPKSTGRDLFHLGWLQSRLGDAVRDPADVLATLCELTAAGVLADLRAQQPDTARLLVCGGGVHNRHLMARLAALAGGMQVESTAALGVDPDFVEAMGFAWLARETLAGRAGNRPEVTGASGPRVLGAIYPA